MSFEATKTRALWTADVLRLLEGRGIDIGCGPDPVTPGVDRFDLEQGDANCITRFVTTRYDFVFGSHVLEHMHDPRAALREWLELLVPGGHLIALVPDEDLYEQGHFPSPFNPDHKSTFTIAKSRSWSPRSCNVLDLVAAMPAEVVSVTLQDQGYDRALMSHGGPSWGIGLGRLALRLSWRFPRHVTRICRACRALGAVIDQTALPGSRVAQIQFILRKRA